VETRPLLALTVGDPAGIGPEIVRAVLADTALRDELRLVALGPSACRPSVVPEVADVREIELAGHTAAWLAVGEGDWVPGRPQASAGRAALDALRLGAELATRGEVDALVTAPVSKEALHLAGERCEGQTELLGRWAGVRPEMLAIADDLRVLLLTRHLPLRAALDAVEAAGVEGIAAHLTLLDEGLRGLGIERPRVACAGLNPHAGEAGILGSEEDELIRPAVERARRSGVDAVGPESPDTVFLRALEGAFDGVLALYHDQAFLPVKLAAPRTGLTVLLGLPYLRVSPAHGTAFDIVGSGTADPGNLRLALVRAAEWARRRAVLQSAELSST